LNATATDFLQAAAALATASADVGDSGSPGEEQFARALRDSGLLPMIAGGSQSEDWPGWSAIAAASARISVASAARAWLFAEYCAGAVIAGRDVAESAEGQNALIALAWNDTRTTATDNAGSQTCSGTWRHVPGAAWADWVLIPGSGTCLEPGVRAGAVDWHLVSRNSFGVEESVRTGALQAAGYQTLVAESARIELPVLMTAQSGLLYSGPARLGAIVGTARAGYEEYVAITKKWVGAIGSVKVAELAQVQSRLATSAAGLKSADLLLVDMCARWDADVVSQDVLVEGIRDAAYICSLCLESLSRLVEQMGARSIFYSNPLQQRIQDLRVMVAHNGMDFQTNMANFGRQQLGVLSE
jgi:alkylation response protein AidB-like acyl-CoA dehydrogenase